MTRRTRRIALLVAGWWAVVACVSVYSVHLARSAPEWYAPQPISQAEQENLANQSTQTAADLFSYASDVAAAQRRSFLARQAGTPVSDEAIEPKTLTLNESQLNAFLSQWEGFMDGRVTGSRFGGRLRAYVSDARVALRPGRLVVAGLLRNLAVLSNTVVSVEFAPRLDERGYLWLGLSHVFSGRLPVPLAILDRPRLSIEQTLQNALPEWQIGAGVGADGLANRDAAAAVAAKLILAALMGRSVDAVVLIPCAVGDMRQTVPLRIAMVEIGDRHITVKLTPLAAGETRSLLQELSD